MAIEPEETLEEYRERRIRELSDHYIEESKHTAREDFFWTLQLFLWLAVLLGGLYLLGYFLDALLAGTGGNYGPGG